ncbi:MAG: hypothetical protein ACLTCI_04990 [[Clostridium] nexile]
MTNRTFGIFDYLSHKGTTEYEEISIPTEIEEKKRLLRLMNVRPAVPISREFSYTG